MYNSKLSMPQLPIITCNKNQKLKTLGLLQAFEESVDLAPLS